MVKATVQLFLSHLISGWILHLSWQGSRTPLPSLFQQVFQGKRFTLDSKQMAAEVL